MSRDNWAQLSVPSKTFVLGEYAVLSGEPGLVLTTTPKFILRVRQTPGTALQISGIHPESPAGRWIAQNNDLLEDHQLAFQDPHEGKGGFGASTAQFILIEALLSRIRGESISEPALLRTYLALASVGAGLAPSGVDLLAQFHGGLCYVDKSAGTKTVFKWPFTDIDYCLIHTGNKLATHQHLQQLPDINLSGLGDIVRAGRKALDESDSRQFIESVRDYAKALEEKKCLDERSKILLDRINSRSDILAAKGCGAMGTDVIFLLIKRDSSGATAWLKSQGFQVVTQGHAVETGLEIKKVLQA